MPSLLKIENLKIGFNQDKNEIKDLTLSVEDSEIVGLVGKSNSGKTIAIQSIMGQVRKKDGIIQFYGEDIDDMDTSSRLKIGINVAPQKRRIFKNNTVLENLNIGAYTIREYSTVLDLLEEVYCLFPRLKNKLDVPAGNLSSGEQMTLGIAKALMSDPLLLIIDELCSGISPMVRDDIFDKLIFLKKMGVSILIADRKALDILEICDRGYLLDGGKVQLVGTAEELKHDEKIISMFKEE